MHNALCPYITIWTCTCTDLSPDDKGSLEAQLKVREDQLAPIYHQVAVAFADLHDTPGRMQEKGVVAVSTVVNSKSYFYFNHWFLSLSPFLSPLLSLSPPSLPLFLSPPSPSLSVGCVGVENIKEVLLLEIATATVWRTCDQDDHESW